MRNLPSIVVVAVLALALWFWTAARTERPPGALPAVPVADRDAGGIAQSAPGMQPTPATDPGVSEARRAVEPEFDGPTVDVLVVDHASAAAVAGATVRFEPPAFDWQALTTDERHALSAVTRRSIEEFLERIGGAVTTDAAGRCRVPRAGRGARVIAREGDRFGVGHQTAGGDPIRIEIRADRALRVRAVDRAGRPAAGVQVRAHRIDAGADAVQAFVLSETDVDGVLVRRHVQQWAVDQPSSRVELRAAVPGGESEAAVVDLLAPPPEVVLVLPPTGSVTVRYVEADGQPVDLRYLDRRSLQLAAFDAPPADSGQENDAFNRRSFEAELREPAQAHLAHVGLGVFLIARAGFGRDLVRFRGPTREGEQVEAELRRLAGHAVMVGRAVDEAGAPAGRRSLRVTCSSEGRVNGAAGRTDADGRFRVPVGDMLVGEESIVSLVADARDGGEPLAAELPARTIAAGDNDLGAVTLEAPRLLVAGRLVVRGPGDPQRVEVQVDRWDGQSYAQEFNLRPRIEADGRFELRGAMPDGTRLRLKVRSEAFLPVEAIECLVGTSDLEIELQTGGEVTASFVVDDEALARRLVYRLREVGAEPRPVDPFTEMMERLGGRRLELGADGGLHQTWAGLAPGTYRLSVLAPGVDAPLLTVDDLLVGDGPCTDPRLAAIDLRGLARNVHVAATAADGQRIADREAFVVVHGAGGASQGFHLGEGEAALVIGTSADLWVVAPGHRVAVRRAVTEDLEVPLEAAPEVRLRVGTGVRLPEGAELLAQLEPELEGSVFLDTGRGMGLANFLSESARVDGDGLARLRPRWGGGMRVTVAIRLGQRSSIVQAVEPRRLDTLQLEPGQVSTLQIDDGALERALDRLR